MADYSKYAKLDPATLQALKAAYAKEGLGYGTPQSENYGYDIWNPTSVNGYQINANTIANPNYQAQGADNSDPTPETISGKDIGSYSKQIGDNVYIYNTNGDLTQVMPTGGRWGSTLDMIKFLAPAVLGMGFPGAGAAVGGALGVGTTAGAALLQAGLAKITGGDPLKAAAFSALMSNAGTQIGDTGFTVGDALKGVKVAQAIDNNDLMSAITGAASMAGGADIKIGDTGYTVGDLMKNGKLLQSVLSGKPQALIGAISKFASSTQNDVIGGLKSAGLTDGSAPDVKDFIEGYFAPGGEGYVEPADNGGYTSQWQTVGTDRIMIQDDGSAIATNENGDPYSLTKAEVDQMVNNGILNTAESGYVAATGGTGNNPGGTKNQPPPPPPAGGTKTPAPTAGLPTAGTPTATTAAPTVSRFGLDPLDVLRMKNDVAHINPLEELFGGSIYNPAPASSAQHNTTSDAALMAALGGTQDDSGGGDVHALLQLLRS
jgi:hypothetical protein